MAGACGMRNRKQPVYLNDYVMDSSENLPNTLVEPGAVGAGVVLNQGTDTVNKTTGGNTRDNIEGLVSNKGKIDIYSNKCDQNGNKK